MFLWGRGRSLTADVAAVADKRGPHRFDVVHGDTLYRFAAFSHRERAAWLAHLRQFATELPLRVLFGSSAELHGQPARGDGEG